MPSLWTLLATEGVCRAHHPEGAPAPQHLPVHRREGEVPQRRGPQPTRAGPHFVLHANTPFSCAPPRPPPRPHSPGLWLFIRCVRRTHTGHHPVSQVRAPCPERGPQTRAFCLPGLLPQGSPHGTLHRSAIRGKCSLLTRSGAACALKLPGHRARPQGPVLRLCHSCTPGGCGARGLEAEWSEPLSTRPQDSCTQGPRLCRLNDRRAGKSTS